MKTLLHICCVPCSVSCIKALREEDIEPAGYWYNPNIHPFTEYKARKNTLVQYADSIGLKLIIENQYGLRSFINATYPDFDNRCRCCYLSRLEQTAAYAAKNGYDNFSTTLLISPYQKHELIIETARQCAEKYNVKFLYRDFRPLFKQGQQLAREAGLYMQKYCGCIFSEEERYQKKKHTAVKMH